VKKTTIQVGDIVYTNDALIEQNCPELCKKPAIVWSINEKQARLRFFDYKYVNPLSYHGVDVSSCVKAPSVIEVLLC
jgi:hypothetical protein